MGLESKITPKGKQWRWDLTFHLVGAQRLVETIRDNENSFLQGIQYGIFSCHMYCLKNLKFI